MKVKRNTIYGVLMLVLIVGAGAMLIKGDGSITGAVVGVGGEVQNVKLYVLNGNYVLEPSELKKDVLVRMEGDVDRLPGCSRAVVIPAFRVSKTFYSGDNVVEFMPDEAGEFNIACSMNMYQGRFSVLESDGGRSDYAEKVEEKAGSCGASGGGCGCGG